MSRSNLPSHKQLVAVIDEGCERSLQQLLAIPEGKAWLKKHNVFTKKTNNQSGDEDEFGNKIFPWYAGVGSWTRPIDGEDAVGGATEQDAIANLAIKRGWKLWMEENYGK